MQDNKPDQTKSLISSKIKKLLPGFFKTLSVLLPPFLLFWGLNSFFFEQNYRRQQIQQREEMGRLLGNITGMAEPRQKFDLIFKQLSQIPFPSKTFDKRLKQILQENRRAVEIYFYDVRGKCFNLDYLPPAPRYVAQKFLVAVNAHDKELNERTIKWLVKFSGYKKAHKKIANSPESIITLGRSNEKQWGGIFKLKNDKGINAGCFIVFINKSPLDYAEMLDKAVADTNFNNSRRYSFAWIDPVKPEKIRPEYNKFDSEISKQVFSLPKGESRFTYKNKLGLINYSESGAVIVALACHQIKPDLLFDNIKFTLKLLLIIFMIVLAPVFAGITDWKPGITAKLVAVFLLGSGTCMSALIFTAFIDKSDREKILKNEFQSFNLSELKKIDEGMVFELEKIKRLLQRKIRPYRYYNDNEFERKLKNFWNELSAISDRFNELILVSKENMLAFKPEVDGVYSSDPDYSSVIYAELILETYQGAFIPTESSGTTASTREIIRSSSSAFSRNFILNGGNFDKLSLAGNSVPTYIDFFLDMQNQGRAILIALLSRAGLQRNYLYKVSSLFDKNIGTDKPRFVALPVDLMPRWPAFPKRKTANNQILREMAVKVISRELPVHEIKKINGKKYLLSAIKGKYLDGYILLMAQPYMTIADKISGLDKKIQKLALLMLLLAVGAAAVSSRLLVKPIGNIDYILANIARGNFRVRMPRARVKEFSAVADRLNHTLEEFHEIRVARSIQEKLWPSGGLRGNDWDLNGKCLTATELGGDHYDWLKLEDGRILISIGDVTGHGIGAAMIQASIKVWLAMNSASCSSASELLYRVNLLHNSYGAKKLPMTCWVGYYYPESGRLNFSSAGQSYPLWLKADRTLQRLKLPGIPLGIRKKNTYKDDEVKLQPGDSIVLYTDGLVETQDRFGKMLGFAGLENCAQKVVGQSVYQSIEYIFAQVSRWGERTDDQTLVILHRNNGDS
ncbi:MAG: SpoIIE family protein phosphatase [Candidatus Rifleibacteriota bacterium]